LSPVSNPSEGAIRPSVRVKMENERKMRTKAESKNLAWFGNIVARKKITRVSNIVARKKITRVGNIVARKKIALRRRNALAAYEYENMCMTPPRELFVNPTVGIVHPYEGNVRQTHRGKCSSKIFLDCRNRIMLGITQDERGDDEMTKEKAYSTVRDFGIAFKEGLNKEKV
jgi:hypothetical protein